MPKPASGAIIIKRIKKAGHGGHHGGAWKVAYADFVTAMMAFFLLLWLLNVTTDEQKRGIADYFEPSITWHKASSGADGLLAGQAIGTTGAQTHGRRGARGSPRRARALRQPDDSDEDADWMQTRETGEVEEEDETGADAPDELAARAGVGGARGAPVRRRRVRPAPGDPGPARVERARREPDHRPDARRAAHPARRPGADRDVPARLERDARPGAQADGARRAGRAAACRTRSRSPVTPTRRPMRARVTTATGSCRPTAPTPAGANWSRAVCRSSASPRSSAWPTASR